MRASLLILSCLLPLSSLPAAADSRATVREVEVREALDGARCLRIELPVGEVHLRGGAGSAVRGDLALRCERGKAHCFEQARALRIEARRAGECLHLELAGWGSGDRDDLTVEGQLDLPAGLDLEVDLQVGSLQVNGMRGHLDAHVAVGELVLELPWESTGSVELTAGIGESRLRLPTGAPDSRRTGWLGSDTRWEGGPGASRIQANVGVGEIDARLD